MFIGLILAVTTVLLPTQRLCVRYPPIATMLDGKRADASVAPMGFTGRRPAPLLAAVALTGAACSTGGTLSSSTAPTPTTEPAGTAQRIVIPPGEFGAFVAGTAVPGERVTYVVGADDGQSLILAVSSVDDSAVLDVFGPSGDLLATDQTESAIAVGEGGDHQIVVGATGGDTTYDLDIQVHPVGVVQFAHHAALGTTVSGAVVSGEPAVYDLHAVAGLTILVTISSEDNNAVFDAYPPNGPRLVAEATTAELTTAENGRYHIVVDGTSGTTTYDLKINLDLDPESTVNY